MAKKVKKSAAPKRVAKKRTAAPLAPAGSSALSAKITGRAEDEALAAVTSTGERLSIRTMRAGASYKDTKVGTFDNLEFIRLRWVRSDSEKDWFEFIPRASNRFAFARSNGKRIQPRRMFTDGGSVPRLLWSFQGFSPWGNAPAFLVHDYQFDAHHCGIGSDSFEEVRDTMMEAVKTLMEIGLVPKDEGTFHWISAGISSSVARKAWDRAYPTCPLPPDVPE